MKIVALGDSLTVGETGFSYTTSQGRVASYPECLEHFAMEYLRNHSEAKLEVVNKGVNGDLTSGMLERFASDVVAEKPDYVIILGGANDIGWGFDVTTITHNLASAYDAARSEGISAVACAVPSILGCDDLIPPRLELNKAINNEALERRIPFLDFFRATADQRNNRLMEEYSADGLHLNAKGYERIGRYVFDEWLRPVLECKK